MQAVKGHNSLIQVARILKNFAEASQFERGRDQRLRNALAGVLQEIGADAFVGRVGIDGAILTAFDYSLGLDAAKKEACLAKVEETARSIRQTGTIYTYARDPETEVEYLFCFLNFQYRTETGRDFSPGIPEFFCFISGAARDGNGRPVYKQRWTKVIARDTQRVFTDDSYRDAVEAYCRAIQLAFLRRSETDSIFPLKISQRFWSAIDDLDPAAARLRPWDHDSSGKNKTVLTASLSFDLRQSTFAMDQAIDQKGHADWLEGMVIILRKITHWYEGVFDKFTGDGVIVHFPVYEFEKRNRDQSANEIVLRATICAWDMIRAVELYTDRLVPNLALWKPSFGPSVGIALDEALWSVDRQGNPIVVGRGVVHACRLGSGPARTVQVSNAIIARLKKLVPDEKSVESLEFVSKEYKEGSGVQMARLTTPPAGHGSENAVLKRLVDNVFSPSYS